VTAGYWMLGAIALGMLLTGLPAAIVLLVVAVTFAAGGIATGALDPSLLTALPNRVTGLLESDLLQALPLYVLMGALLNRLPLAAILFRAGLSAIPGAAAPRITALGLGALLGPMNGSVGGSVAMLSRAVYPPLVAAHTPPAAAAALVCVASTLGVVVPPSLVLILLGDAMMRAHTEAVNVTHASVQIINTQLVFRGTLVPAALLLLACVLVSWLSARRSRARTPSSAPLTAREWAIAAATLAIVGGLLAGVAAGYLYAVEAAATGGFLLLVAALASGQLRGGLLRQVLSDTLVISGALFVLFVAATTFTLVFRAFGTDRHLADLLLTLPGGPGVALAAVLGLLAACALVLDAFEIIFVIVPLVMPALLIRVPDATWVAALSLLTLQASFLVPPFGYAIMMARGNIARDVPLAALTRALAPFLLAQLAVVGITIAFPALVHVLQPAASEAALAPALSDDEQRDLLDRMTRPPADEEPPTAAPR
jgi:TRAP-type mannitol/chloroaromatic compound transport system permease large subunit